MSAILRSKDDFEWHVRKLDADRKYLHRHDGEPTHYPCKVESEWWDDPNGPYTYQHRFTYQQTVVCESCQHETVVWPEETP